MKEYIEREVAKEMLQCYGVTPALIDYVPAADVAPVRHGKWEQHPQSSKNEPVYTCSLCKLNVSDFEKRWLKYCPNCGAPMTDEAVDMMLERMETIR